MLQFWELPANICIPRKRYTTNAVLQTDGGFEKEMKLRTPRFLAAIRSLCRSLFPDCHIPDRNL
jgi:hypothetical protein